MSNQQKKATKLLARLKYYYSMNDNIKRLQAGYFYAINYITQQTNFDLIHYSGDRWSKICELTRQLSVPEIEHIVKYLEEKKVKK